MSVNQVILPKNSAESFFSYRRLGLIGIAASPALFVSMFLGGLNEPTMSLPRTICETVFWGGWLASAIGFWQLAGTERSVARKIVFGVQMVGLTLAGVQQVYDLLYQDPNLATPLYQIANIAWPFSVTFMLVVGVLALRAQVWQGWQRFILILCGLALPVMMLCSILAGRAVGGVVFGLHTTVTWALLGYALYKTE